SRPTDAFTRLRELLDGGRMIHTYQPFFAELGAHARGTLDCPYGHVRLTPDEHLRYLSVLRPHEADAAIPWVRDALNRRTQREIQRDLVDSGFAITAWRPDRAPQPRLTHEVV